MSQSSSGATWTHGLLVWTQCRCELKQTPQPESHRTSLEVCSLEACLHVLSFGELLHSIESLLQVVVCLYALQRSQDRVETSIRWYVDGGRGGRCWCSSGLVTTLRLTRDGPSVTEACSGGESLLLHDCRDNKNARTDLRHNDPMQQS